MVSCNHDWKRIMGVLDDVVEETMSSDEPFNIHMSYYNRVAKTYNPRHEFSFKQYVRDCVNELLDDYNEMKDEEGFTLEDAKFESFFRSYHDLLEPILSNTYKKNEGVKK